MQKCDVCGKVCTTAHKYYHDQLTQPSQCVDEFEKHWLTKTKFLGYKGRNSQFSPKCLWFRGILPYSKSWGLVESAQQQQTAKVQAGDLSGPLWLGADAGGSDRRSKVTCKVGVGGVVISWVPDTQVIRGIGIVFSNLPESAQTVPRGEAYAPLVTLQALDLAQASFHKWACDAACVVQKSHKLLHHPQELRKTCLASRHGDIWFSLYEYLFSGTLPLPTKVKSHVDFGATKFTDEEYRLHFCNVIADVAASVANSVYDYALGILKEVEALQTQSFLTCVRFAIVEYRVSVFLRHNEVSRETPPKVKEVSEGDFSQEIKHRILGLGHDLQRHLNGRRLVCIRCKNQFPKNDTKPWETLQCIGNGQWLNTLSL